MTREEKLLRQEYYAADLKCEHHRAELAKWSAEKERIWKRILENKNPELADIVKIGN